MEAPSQEKEKPTLEAQLEALEREIKEVKEEIAEVVSQLKQLEKTPLKMRDQDEKDEIKRLSKKEEQLRTKEEQLREEKRLLLLRSGSVGRSEDNELLKRFDELSLEVRAIASQKVQYSASDSQRGSKLLHSLRQQGRLEAFSGEGEAVFSADKMQVLEKQATNEEILVELVTPRLCELLRSDSSSQTVLVNSERVAWIDTCWDKANFRKPDLFVSCGFFCQHEGTRPNTVDEMGAHQLLFGKPALWALRDSVSVLIEVKLDCKNELLGQLQNDFEFLCRDEHENRERSGVALLKKEFYVFDFLGSVAVHVVHAKWTDPGSRDLLARALCRKNVWSTCADLVATKLNVRFAEPVSNGFLGMGAYGRVVRVVCNDQSDGALKLIMNNSEDVCQRALKEFEIARQAEETGVVIRVFESCKELLETNGSFTCGYTMEMGSPASTENVLDLVTALSKLHCAGWVHGDARFANIVHVEGRGLVWIDMTEACRFRKGADGAKSCVALEMRKFIASLYARKNNVSSSNVKLSRAVVDSISAYAEAVIQQAQVAESIQHLVETLSSWKVLSSTQE